MGFRFRRTFSLLTGIRLNLNKGSVSLRVGGRGAGFTASSNGSTTETIGIPGAGFFWTKRTGRSKATARTCEACSASLTASAKFCPQCGRQASDAP